MRLANRNIIILGHAKFDSVVESTAYTIANYLARTNRVFYAEHPFTWRDYFRFKGQPEFDRRAPYFFGNDGVIETAVPNLHVIVTPPVLSINFLPENAFYRTLLRVNDHIVARRIKKVIRKYRLDDVVYLNIFNFHFPGVADLIRPRLRVYYSVDPMITPYDIRHGIVSEEQLVRTSDLVICTSRQLQEEKVLQNPHTFFIPNAADIHHSKKALDEHLAVHPKIAQLKKPVIGYFGTIERRFDFALLKDVITGNPDKNFVLAGPVSEEFIPDWIRKAPNVLFTGKIPYQEMPAMVKGFDVAIIPFKKDNVSRTIFPLKLFEYLGAGKPVVCTDFNPDLGEFTGNTVTYCRDALSFSAAIAHGLTDDEAAKNRRIAVAGQNTWEERIKEITDLLGKFF